jgi:hypothetical protein
MVRSKLMNLSGSERFIMGAQMFDAARRMALASLPSDLPPEELKRQLFERIYGTPAPF